LNRSLKDLLARAVARGHRGVLRASGGRVGARLDGMTVLQLTTVGRRTGQRRTTMLTTPLVRGDDVVVVASYGGDDRHPQWYLNLVAEPEATLEIGGEARPVRARLAAGDEREALWRELVAAHPRYSGYQDRTERAIPVVVLEGR